MYDMKESHVSIYKYLKVSHKTSTRYDKYCFKGR